MFYHAESPITGVASVPERLMLRIPAGQVITQISHGASGSPCVLNLEIGQTDGITESTHLTLAKSAIVEKGGHQIWQGKIKASQDLYVKGWLRSVATGGSHALVVFTEAT